jgi:hypothetical protein
MQEAGVTILFVSHDPAAIRALCSRAILLNHGRVVSDAKPLTVLNHYQKIIMAREEAYEASESSEQNEEEQAPVMSSDNRQEVHYTYRHGDRSAEIISVELLDARRQRVELVESGESLTVRVLMRSNSRLEAVVCGFLIRNRHGIHLYGTNTEIQHLDLGPLSAGEILEVTFAFDCWLAPDTYSLTVAAHSSDGISFDWLDGALFFRVMSALPMEGVANLNASVKARRLSGEAERKGERLESSNTYA